MVVLPVPDWLCAITSRPFRIGMIARCWIALGRSKPEQTDERRRADATGMSQAQLAWGSSTTSPRTYLSHTVCVDSLEQVFFESHTVEGGHDVDIGAALIHLRRGRARGGCRERGRGRRRKEERRNEVGGRRGRRGERAMAASVSRRFRHVGLPAGIECVSTARLRSHRTRARTGHDGIVSRASLCLCSSSASACSCCVSVASLARVRRRWSRPRLTTAGRCGPVTTVRISTCTSLASPSSSIMRMRGRARVEEPDEQVADDSQTATATTSTWKVMR